MAYDVKTHFELTVFNTEHSVVGINCYATCGQKRFRCNSVFQFIYILNIDAIENKCISHHVMQIAGDFDMLDGSFEPCEEEWEESPIKKELFDRALEEAERIFTVTGAKKKLLKNAQKVISN